MELVDFTEEFRGSKFKIFAGAVANQGVVKAINAKGLAGVTQGQMDTMTEYAKSFGAKGLAFIKVEGGEWKSPIVRFFSEAEKAALTSKLAIAEGDLILFAADQWLTACEILGKIRLYCADVLKGQGKLVVPADRFDFLWVIDFPLLSFDKEQNRWYSSHHPFTAPVAEDVPMLKTEPKKVRGSALRRRGERRGTGRRLNPYPPARRAEDGIRRGAADSAGGDEAALRLHARGLSVWRPAARRHRAWLRPAHRDSLRHAQHPGRDCFSEDREGHVPHDRVAFAHLGAPVARSAHRVEGAEAGVAHASLRASEGSIRAPCFWYSEREAGMLRQPAGWEACATLRFICLGNGPSLWQPLRNDVHGTDAAKSHPISGFQPETRCRTSNAKAEPTLSPFGWLELCPANCSPG